MDRSQNYIVNSLEQHLFFARIMKEHGPFSNVNPVTNNWIAGFVGISGIHIDCIANYDESRVEFYLGMASKEQNKALFDFLFARKDNIEATMGTQLIWSRMDDNKASKIHSHTQDGSVCCPGNNGTGH